MKEPRCAICANQAALTAVRELHGKSVSLRQIASRLKLSKSSVARHVKHAGLSGAGATRGSGRKSSQAVRDAKGRCTACGISVADTEPQSLLRRAERLLHGVELVVERAAADEDPRLQLQATDRVRSALELLMKAHGLLQSDGAVTVNVNAAEVMTLRKALSVITAAIEGERRQAECLSLFQAFLHGETYELPVTIEGEVIALPAVTDNR